MRESVYTVVERALADRAGEWLPPPRDGAGARFDLAARIAVDTALPLVPTHHANDRIETLRSQLERLQSRVAKLEAVAAAVRNATIRDHNVYGEMPDMTGSPSTADTSPVSSESWRRSTRGGPGAPCSSGAWATSEPGTGGGT